MTTLKAINCAGLLKPALTVHITFNLIDLEPDSEESVAKTQTLLRQLRAFDVVRQVDLNGLIALRAASARG